MLGVASGKSRQLDGRTCDSAAVLGCTSPVIVLSNIHCPECEQMQCSINWAQAVAKLSWYLPRSLLRCVDKSGLAAVTVAVSVSTC